MTTWSTEDLVDSAIDFLGGNLAAALDVIYAARADKDAAAGRSIEYEAPRPGLAEVGGDYYAGGVSTILRYPCVEVALPDLRMTNFDIAHFEADVTENLIVCLWEKSANMVTLYRKLTRLAAAAYDVLASEQARAALGADLQDVRAAWRWNPEANERDEIESGALLVLGMASSRLAP